MTRIHAVLISFVLLASPGTLFAEEDASRKKTTPVRTAQAVGPCQSYCLASTPVPVYIPKNRGAPRARIGTSTRGAAAASGG